MLLISVQPSSTVKCLKTEQSIFPNLLATLLRLRKTLSGNLAKHSMALNNLVTSGTKNLKAFLSRLVSRHANLIHAFLFAHHSQQPPSSHLMFLPWTLLRFTF